jgi:endoribonuclease Dicer
VQVIIYLDTGSGKTFVAVLLIKFLHGQAEARHRAAHGPRPLAVFMAPTVQLVEQQANVLKCQLDLRVSKYEISVGHCSQINKTSAWQQSVLHNRLRSCVAVPSSPSLVEAC